MGYTTLRKVYAWTGFLAILAVGFETVRWVLWAQAYVDAAIPFTK